MDILDLLGLPGAIGGWMGRAFGRLAVAVWYWGAPPARPGTLADQRRTTASETYRLVWRVGQVLGWLTTAAFILVFLWAVYLR